MDRRTFLGTAAAAAPWLLRSRIEGAEAGGWRTFEIRFHVEIPDATPSTRVWLPLPLPRDTPYQRALGHEWTGNATSCKVEGEAAPGPMMIAAEWTSPETTSTLDVIMRVATKNIAVPLHMPSMSASTKKPTPVDLAQHLKPTTLMPTDGIVRETAVSITRGHKTSLAKARAIYDWVVERTHRDPKVQGCGLGDIRWMLETGNLGGKCADLNALFVGLSRAAGLPARHLYGIRVGPSKDFKSLGRAGTITTGQHCRAEVYLANLGWVPADPADVRKAILEERPDAKLTDPDIVRLRARLFGSWEMNWIAFNDTHDVRLPGSSGKPLPYLMYPQAEIGGTRKNSVEADRFRYTIASADIN